MALWLVPMWGARGAGPTMGSNWRLSNGGKAPTRQLLGRCASLRRISRCLGALRAGGRKRVEGEDRGMIMMVHDRSITGRFARWPQIEPTMQPLPPLIAGGYQATTFDYTGEGDFAVWQEVFVAAIPTFKAHGLTDAALPEGVRKVSSRDQIGPRGAVASRDQGSTRAGVLAHAGGIRAVCSLL